MSRSSGSSSQSCARLDKKATSISLLVALGVREDGQNVLLAVKNMSGEHEAAWRALLDDLVKRGLKTPELVIVDGAPGLAAGLPAGRRSKTLSWRLPLSSRL
jgi:putative transposase